MKNRYLLFLLLLLANSAYTQDHSIIPCPVSCEIGNDGDFQLSAVSNPNDEGYNLTVKRNKITLKAMIL